MVLFRSHRLVLKFYKYKIIDSLSSKCQKQNLNGRVKMSGNSFKLTLLTWKRNPVVGPKLYPSKLKVDIIEEQSVLSYSELELVTAYL